MKKVLIIGAGPAGITAGYELMKRTGQYDVTILEESSQVGGISKTVRHKGFRMDLGGHCFRTENEVILNWWKEILPQQGAGAF
ncbi:MAG: NAD(P)-binding protein, partial [Lachnospiraceae bacterium]|nr:NAD(P)-binding protein [Lachnospiraceae bacterium]